MRHIVKKTSLCKTGILCFFQSNLQLVIEPMNRHVCVLCSFICVSAFFVSCCVVSSTTDCSVAVAAFTGTQTDKVRYTTNMLKQKQRILFKI